MSVCLVDLQKGELQWGIASGKQLPFDAGHFKWCESFEGSNYFMTSMQASVKPAPTNTTTKPPVIRSLLHSQSDSNPIGHVSKTGESTLFANYFGNVVVNPFRETSIGEYSSHTNDLLEFRNAFMAAGAVSSLAVGGSNIGSMIDAIDDGGGSMIDATGGFPVRLGLCMPNSCSKEEVKYMIEHLPEFLVNKLGPIAKRLQFSNVDPVSPKDTVDSTLDTVGMLGLSLILVLIAAVVFSSVYIAAKNSREKAEMDDWKARQQMDQEGQQQVNEEDTRMAQSIVVGDHNSMASTSTNSSRANSMITTNGSMNTGQNESGSFNLRSQSSISIVEADLAGAGGEELGEALTSQSTGRHSNNRASVGISTTLRVGSFTQSRTTIATPSRNSTVDQSRATMDQCGPLRGEPNRQYLSCQQVPDPKPKFKPTSTFIQAFSLVGTEGTLVKLFDCPPQKKTDSLNGLRVLSMIWIILGHTFLMPLAISGFINAEDIVGINTIVGDTANYAAEGNWLFMFIIGSEIGVDTFFFMSGFLLAYLMVKELEGMKKRGKKQTFLASLCNVLKGIIFRYIRLTPSLAFVLLFFMKILYVIPYGPFAPAFQKSITDRCGNGSEWSMLLYGMNFFPFDSNLVCMGWTWYLGDDMIFFIISSIIVMIYCSRKFLGISIMGMLALASICITTELIYVYDLGPYVFDAHYQRYSYYSYSKPYCRIPAYFVGVATAWTIAEIEDRLGKRGRILSSTGSTRQTTSGRIVGGPLKSRKALLVQISAFLACAMILFIILIPATDSGALKNTWTPMASNLYLSFGRIVWAMCYAVLLLGCYFGHLPTLDKLLGHWIWTPLTRLTYGAYLCHPLIIKVNAGNSLQFYTWSYTDVMYRLIGNVFGAYLCSMIVWCLVERPVMTLTTVLLKGKKKYTVKDDKEEFADKGALAVYFRAQQQKNIQNLKV